MTKNRELLIYAFSLCVSLLLASFIFFCIPKKYAARIEISDEPKETDVNIGMTRSAALEVKDNLMNDPDIYSQLLGSKDFIKKISQIRMDSISYGQYLLKEKEPFWSEFASKMSSDQISKDEEIFAIIQRRVRYQKKRSLILICVEDASPVNAVKIADSVVAKLQNNILSLKLTQTKAKLLNSKKNYRIAKEEYFNALKTLSNMSDSLADVSLPSYEAKIKELQNTVDFKRNLLNQAIEKVVRLQSLTQKSSRPFTIVSNATVPLESSNPSFLLCFSPTFFILFLITFWYINIKKRKLSLSNLDFGDWFSPWCITIIVWILIIIFVKLEGNKLYPLTTQFYVSISLWVPILCIVSFITFIVLQKQKRTTTYIQATDANESIYNILFYTAVLLTPIYFWQVYKIVSQFNAADIMNNIRILATSGHDVGWLKYTVVINQSLFLVSIWRYPKIPLWKLLIVYACNLICSLSLMEKGSMFMLVICTMFVLYEKKKIKLRTFAIAAALIIILAYFFNTARETSDTNESNTAFIDFFGMYITSPPVAFSRLSRDVSGQIGANTFEVFYDFLNRFGIGHFDVLKKEQDFVMVPVFTNVYTIMQPFYVDFGYGGVAFFAAVYGLFSGVLYHLFREGNPICKCLYTFLVQILILQFYQENVFMSISGLTQLAILILLMTQNKISIIEHKYVQH